MNKGPGGKQPKMRDTTWNGQTQTLILPDGRPKGAALVLEERGYDTKGVKLDEMRTILAGHDDFKSEECQGSLQLRYLCPAACMGSTPTVYSSPTKQRKGEG